MSMLQPVDDLMEIGWMYNVSPTTREEIDAYCVRDVKGRGWQAFRRSLKGLPTKEKMIRLKQWHNRWCVRSPGISSAIQLSPPVDVRVQIDNYINALLRGGQLVRVGSMILVQR